MKIRGPPDLVTLEGIKANSNVLMITQGMCRPSNSQLKRFTEVILMGDT